MPPQNDPPLQPAQLDSPMSEWLDHLATAVAELADAPVAGGDPAELAGRVRQYRQKLWGLEKRLRALVPMSTAEKAGRILDVVSRHATTGATMQEQLEDLIADSVIQVNTMKLLDRTEDKS